jgi:hypothetical protein
MTMIEETKAATTSGNGAHGQPRGDRATDAASDHRKLLRLATAFVEEACRQYPHWEDDAMRLDSIIRAMLMCFECDMEHVFPYLKARDEWHRRRDNNWSAEPIPF